MWPLEVALGLVSHDCRKNKCLLRLSFRQLHIPRQPLRPLTARLCLSPWWRQELSTCWDVGDDRASPGGHLGQMTEWQAGCPGRGSPSAPGSGLHLLPVLG